MSATDTANGLRGSVSTDTDVGTAGAAPRSVAIIEAGLAGAVAIVFTKIDAGLAGAVNLETDTDAGLEGAT